jgi:hypothetical protein
MNANFYEVKIGTMTRRGDLNATHSFVCQSDKNEYQVRDYYQSKYRGFNVKVTPVEKIEVLEVASTDFTGDVMTKENKQVYELQDKLKQLTNEIKVLQGSKNKSFDVELRYIEFTGEAEVLFNDMLEKRSIYYDACTALDTHIKNNLMKKYQPFACKIETTDRVEGRDNYKGRVELHNAIF